MCRSLRLLFAIVHLVLLMNICRFAEFVWATREAVVPPTARELAERWIRALSGSEPVESAQADAEVQFRSEELAANWRESLLAYDFMMGPASNYLLPHWRAGVEYTKQMSLGYGEAAAGHIRRAPEYESFLQESVAILAEKAYREKLQPYDGLMGEAVGRAVGQFHEFVRTAVTDELAKLTLAAWQRHREIYQRKSAETTASVDGRVAQAEPAATAPPPITEAQPAWCDAHGKGTESAAAPPAVAEAPPRVRGDATPTETVGAMEAAVDGNIVAEVRDARLQAFIRRHNTTIAAVSEAALVYKPDMQHWRHEELSGDSVMSQRIENVLSGKTPLKAGEAKPAPAA